MYLILSIHDSIDYSDGPALILQGVPQGVL